MKIAFKRWNLSVDNSIEGKDYAQGAVRAGEPIPHFWTDDDRYRPYFDDWSKRPEYTQGLRKASQTK